MLIKAGNKELSKTLVKTVYQLSVFFWSNYDFPSIRPVPCSSKATGEIGTCMYSWSCHHVAKGLHIGTCVDRFFVGTCCKVPPSTSTASSLWNGIKGHHTTRRPQLETLATVIEILTLTDKQYNRKPVSSVYNKITFRPSTIVTSATTRSTFATAESVSSTPNSSHVSGSQLVEIIPYEKFHRPIYPLVEVTSNNSTHSTEQPTPHTVDKSSSTVSPSQYDTNSHVLSKNDLDKLPIVIEPSKWTEPPYPWPSPSPSSLPIVQKNDSYLDSLDASQVCGRTRRSPMGRIVGGRRSEYLKWPWMISLRRFEGRTFRHKCGATLLNRLWAITAAHCVDGKMPNELLLRLGEYNFHQENESHPHVERRVYLMVIHPKFDSVTYENDLALLRFYEPVKYHANVMPVCLPQRNDDEAGRTAVVTGWGRLAEEGELPGSLHEVHMPILTNKECERMYSDAGYVEAITDVFVCAGLSHGGLDACEGDSGGPMVVRGNNGPWALVGLISWGMGCAAPNQPGVYTRITKFVDWIQEMISF